MAKLIDTLIASGVEVQAASSPFTADGREYPAGTVVLWRDQPYGNYVKDLFELQAFPPGVKPYDVSGWTMPLLLGVRRVTVTTDFTARTAPLAKAADVLAAFPGDPRADETTLSAADGTTWTTLAGELQAGREFSFHTEGEKAGTFSPGSASDHNAVHLDELPRVGVYSPWSESMDEGWLRYVLDDFKIPFVTVKNEQLRAGDLGAVYDVLVIPDVTAGRLNAGRTPGTLPPQFTGGLDPEGALAVEAFVRGGGKLVCLGDSSTWAVDLFRLPVVETTKGAKDFSCPGSILRGTFEQHPLTAGLPADTPLFFAGGLAWRPMTSGERDSSHAAKAEITTLLRYAPNHTLLSGYLSGGEAIAGQSAWMTTRVGDGTIHLFGFRPHYRGWSQVTFPLLFRALLME